MDDDLLFRRLGRTAVVLCTLMTLAALAVAGVRVAAAVVGGGVLIGVSYFALGSSTRALGDLVSGQAVIPCPGGGGGSGRGGRAPPW